MQEERLNLQEPQKTIKNSLPAGIRKINSLSHQDMEVESLLNLLQQKRMIRLEDHQSFNQLQLSTEEQLNVIIQ